MKFYYQYRTSDNVRHDGEIRASSREAAFAALKAKGIRPGCVEEAPGFFNKLFGKGKRWIAIAVLAIAVAALLWNLRETKKELSAGQDASEEVSTSMDRRQILGDAAMISRGVASDWADVFARKSDRFLARYAQPGLPVSAVVGEERDSLAKELLAVMDEPSLEAAEGDLDEIRQIKMIVAGIRAELSEYVADGGSVEKYMDCLDQRQQYESRLRATAERELVDSKRSKSEEEYTEDWKRVNTELRKFGIGLIPLDEDF